MEDYMIVDLYHRRDEAAIRETETKYGGYLFTIAKNIVGDEDGREVVNDTYLRAWNSMPPHKPSVLSTFLGRITRGLAIDRFRRLGSIKRQSGCYVVSLEELSECVGSTPESGSPEDALEYKRLVEVLSRWLDGLCEKERIIFVRRYYFCDPLREIAADLVASEPKVKSILFRLRKSLKTLLTEETLL